jgi:hypothetical protein
MGIKLWHALWATWDWGLLGLRSLPGAPLRLMRMPPPAL